MSDYPRPQFSTGLAVACAALLLLGRWHLHQGGSVDFGMHYALANHLYSSLIGDAGSGAFLDGMKDYPPGAHWIAAILSIFTHSPLVSINVLTIVATFGGYLAMSLLVTDGPPLRDIVRLVAMLAAIVLLRFEGVAFGGQVIVNFFFPQLLGEAIALGGIFWLSTGSFLALSNRAKGIALFGACWILAWVQPLAALQFGLTATVFALFLGWTIQGDIWSTARLLLIPSAFAVAVLLGVVANPAMWFMVKAAAHDGALSFGTWITPKSYLVLVFLSLCAAAMSIYGAHLGRLPRHRAFLLAAACVAGSSFVLIQQAALSYLGIGSTYAIGKHIFFLATATMVALTYALVGLLPVRWSSLRVGTGVPRFSAVLPAIFATFAVLAVFGGSRVRSQSLLPLIEYQRTLRDFIQYTRAKGEDGKTMSLNRALSGYDNYLVSFGDLRLPSNTAYKVFEAGIPSDPRLERLVVTRIGADQDVITSCTAGLQLSWHWAVVLRDCMSSALSRLTLNKPVRTVHADPGAAFLVQGWWTPEAWGTWSASKNAVIKFNVADNLSSTNTYRLRIRYRPFILKNWPVQKYTVLLNGNINQEIVATTGEGEFSVGPFGVGQHVVELRIETARSPKELGHSLDPRELGIGVTELELIEGGAR